MRLLQTLLLSCKNAAALWDKGAITRLSFIQRLQLRAHVGICKGCGVYKEQTELIDDFLENRSGEKGVGTQALEARIKKEFLG